MAKEFLLHKSPDTVPPLSHEQTLLPLFDEFDGGKEVEGKLGMKESVSPIPLLAGLVDHFGSRRSFVYPVVPDVISSTSIIDKYAYHGQHFSVVNREDGVSFVKVKTNKHINDGIIVADEQKRLLPGGKGLFDTGILADTIDPDAIECLGTLRKHKDQLLVTDALRVYQIVCDTTTILDDEACDRFPEVDPLQQIEIEYKGTYSFLTSFVSMETLVADVSASIRDLRDDVQDYLSHNGVASAITTETKTKWMKHVLRGHA